MHGGAPGSGAPKGNKNALKTGRYTKQAIEERCELRRLIRASEKFLDEIVD
jgi:glucans biosynthesis protein